MLRRLFCPLLAAAVLGTALWGAADRAEGAIRIRISDGTTDQFFYRDSNADPPVFTSLGAFDIVVQNSMTNSGNENVTGFGQLTQDIFLVDNSTGTGTLPMFTFLADVIDDIPGLSSGQINATQFNLGVLTRFTAPPFNSELSVLSRVSGNDAQGTTPAGMVRNETTVNGNSVDTPDVGINSGNFGLAEETMTNAANGYTLSSEIVLTNANVGANGITIQGLSRVSAHTPEPGSMAVWALGAIGLAVAAAGRRRFRRADAH